MSFSLIHRFLGVLRRLFQSGAQEPDVLTTRIAGSPAFLFKIGYSTALGRHAIATQALAEKPPGTLLLRELSHIWVPSEMSRELVCHECGNEFRPTKSSRGPWVACQGCGDKARYCSTSCRNAHATLHQPICKILGDAATLAARHQCPIDLVYAILALVAKRAVKLSSTSESTIPALLCCDPLAFDAGPEAFSEMLSHSGALNSSAQRSLRGLAASIRERLPEKIRPPIDLFFTWASQINSNSHGLSRASHSNEYFGIGLFPMGSIFNHSCLPNCTYTNEGAQLVFRLLRNVSEGEELCVNYTELYAARDERRAELWASKSFECRCRRCILSPDGHDEVRLIGAEPFVSAVLCDQTKGCYGFLHQCDVINDPVGARGAKWRCSVCHKRCTYGHLLDTHLTPLRDRLHKAMLEYSQEFSDASAASLRDTFESILESALACLHPSHALVFKCYIPLINCCSALKNYTDKERYARSLVGISTAVLPDYPPMANYLEAFAQSLNELVITTPAMPRNLRQAYAQEKIISLRRSLQIYEVCYGIDHLKTVQARDRLRRAESGAKSR